MIEFLQKNAWLISSGSLVVALFSAFYSIRNFKRTWSITERTIFLKQEKALLKPIIELSVEDYFTIEKREYGSSKEISYKPYYSKLNNVIQGIPAEKIKNQELSKRILGLQKMHIDNLFKPTTIGKNSWVDFGNELNEVIILSRRYLAEVN